MHRFLAIPALIAIAVVASIGVNAAGTSAQIVSCAATTWCFSPNPITVTAGSTVTWSNGTAATHTATSTTTAWTTGNVAPGATSVAITFNTAGTFPYHCAIHPFMTGTIVVTAAAAASTPPRATTPPVVRQLARGGAGPLLPIAGATLLVGLGLLGIGLVRPAPRRRRPHAR